jgi:hypothetical protein
MMKVLAPHSISYPLVDDRQVPPVMQTNGQLMGSILSFPVLCLANLALFLYVRSFTMPLADIDDLINSVLVNGDDMLYIGTPEEWDLHCRFGLEFGLRITPGKAYIHHRYANVNSISCDYDLTVRDSLPSRIGFLNVGLFMGQNKVMGRSEESKINVNDKQWYRPHIDVINELMSGCQKHKRVETLKMYLARHKEEIRVESRGLNLFIPESNGGLGVEKVDGFSFHITDRQKKIALQFLSFPSIMKDERPYRPGEKVPIPRQRRPLLLDSLDEHSNFLERVISPGGTEAKPWKGPLPKGFKVHGITRPRVLLI